MRLRNSCQKVIFDLKGEIGFHQGSFGVHDGVFGRDLIFTRGKKEHSYVEARRPKPSK